MLRTEAGAVRVDRRARSATRMSAVSQRQSIGSPHAMSILRPTTLALDHSGSQRHPRLDACAEAKSAQSNGPGVHLVAFGAERPDVAVHSRREQSRQAVDVAEANLRSQIAANRSAALRFARRAMLRPCAYVASTATSVAELYRRAHRRTPEPTNATGRRTWVTWSWCAFHRETSRLLRKSHIAICNAARIDAARRKEKENENENENEETENKKEKAKRCCAAFRIDTTQSNAQTRSTRPPSPQTDAMRRDEPRFARAITYSRTLLGSAAGRRQTCPSSAPAAASDCCLHSFRQAIRCPPPIAAALFGAVRTHAGRRRGSR